MKAKVHQILKHLGYLISMSTFSTLYQNVLENANAVIAEKQERCEA